MSSRGTSAEVITPEGQEMFVIPQQDNQPLRACAEAALRKYFADLEGHMPGNLYDLVIHEIEEPLLRAVLEFTRGNQSRAAEVLGINRSTLRKKLRFHGLHD